MKEHQSFNTSYLFEKDHTHRWAFQKSLFTKDECQSIINYANSFKKELGIIDSNTFNENIRKSNIVWIYPNPETMPIYERLSNCIKNLNDQFFKFDLLVYMNE